MLPSVCGNLHWEVEEEENEAKEKRALEPFRGGVLRSEGSQTHARGPARWVLYRWKPRCEKVPGTRGNLSGKEGIIHNR